MTVIQPIHPFPARMAPEIALEACATLPAGSVVLDPLAGSGTVLRVAAEHGHRAVGFDLDPLAVLMARVWTTPLDPAALRSAAAVVAGRCQARPDDVIALPWIDEDQETCAFVDYWFGAEQRADLRRLSLALHEAMGPIGDALRLALSRIIISKDRGASLARDVSHSRPHRAYAGRNDFAVIAGFARAAERLARHLELQPPPGNVTVARGDARQLTSVPAASIEAVITSPPYLNAIDYLRGHRLALVWLGHRIGDLRRVRADSIGAERRPAPGADGALAEALLAPLGPLGALPPADRAMLRRYALDLLALMTELSRVLRPGGGAVLVVGNSSPRGVFIRNSRVVAAAAHRVDLRLIREVERALPPNRRYLPPPGIHGAPSLERRMRTESVMTFIRQ